LLKCRNRVSLPQRTLYARQLQIFFGIIMPEPAPAATLTFSKPQDETSDRDSLKILIYIALATVVVHLLVGNRYGFHRDELATLDDAGHLAWGYVAYPPVTPFFARISWELFGASVRWFRLFANISLADVVVLAGLMAHEMGGRRWAQIVAAVCAVPYCLGAGVLMQYVAFDALAWSLTAYFVIRLMKSGDARWWIAIGASIGLGMMSKWTMGFLALGVVAGVLFTDARRYLRSKWLWIGVALSLLIFFPNLLWQAQHHFISLDMLKHIHKRDIGRGLTTYFLPQQLQLTGLRTPFAIAGLYFYFWAAAGRRFRIVGWMYLVPLLLFVILRGRWYYLGPGYPLLYAAGSVWGEGWLGKMEPKKAKGLRGDISLLLAIDILLSTIWMPIAPLQTKWWNIAASVQGDYKEEVGWQELVREVARIRDTLTPEQRAHLGILAGNYGEAGAINLYGPQYGLPQAISGINSFWARGYGNPAPETLIVLGVDWPYLEKRFTDCRIAGHPSNPYGVINEETGDHPDMYVCGPPKTGWPEFWKTFQYFG
jgi:hypothetical protein